jgi:tetratricopeptide (TPR) repeat protein
MKKSFVCCVLLLCSLGGYACLNGETRQLKDGYYLYEDFEGAIVPHGHRFFLSELPGELLILDSLYKSTNDIDYLSDYALLLIIQKKYSEAIAIYLDIEKKFPGRYSTASNLGTAYELTGENDKALHWIKKSVEIDPHSHAGSEWIHVKILETKVNGGQPETDALLGVDFGEGNGPYSTIKNKELLAMRSELYYQLNERISFVDPPDPIVATLMLAQADLAILTGAVRDAIELYEKAKTYGANSDLVNFRLAYANKSLRGKLSKAQAPPRNYTGLYASLAAVFITLAFLVIVKMRSK